MHIGVTVRNMGPQSEPGLLRRCTMAAEQAGLESVWITDHIAIPPDDAEGSGGRYLDTLTTLAWMAGCTEKIKLGSGVLILPYRPALPTAKQIATLQEVSGGRLLLGVGIGWMDAEFKALGLDRAVRGRTSDAMLEFLNACFDQDVVTQHGQDFLFKPRPVRPPVLVGGRAPHALERALKYGDGWLPMAGKPEHIAEDVKTYRELAARAGKTASVTVMTGLPLSDPEESAALLDAYRTLSVDRLVCALRYDTEKEYCDQLNALMDLSGA